MDSPDYRVGRFTLKPFRQLLDGSVPVPIGRKALDLLSVLAKARGALVTKDELMAAVWPKSIVEENVIQVHIAALRKTLGKDAELLNTVHGLGYRLTAAPEIPSADATSQVPPQARPVAATRGWALPVALAAVSIVAVAAAGLWFLRDQVSPAPKPTQGRVAVLPFDTSGPDARGFADGLLDEIVGELADNHIQVVSRKDSQSLHGAAAGPAIDSLGVDLLLDGSVQSDGKTLDVRVYLDDAREHVSIWSGEFKGAVDAARALQASVAAQAADVLYWGKAGRSGKVRLDAASLAAFIAGRESTTGVRNGSQAEADYRQVVAAVPDFSWGHSAVAVSNAFELLHPQPEPGDEALRAEARREAKRALELEPHNGEAYLALELAWPMFDWKGRETLLLQGTAADPNFEPIVMMEGRLLAVVGRGRDALPWLQHAHDMNPLHNGEALSLALSLASEGHPAESRALVTRMQVDWPDHISTKTARFWTSVLLGATDEALAQLAEPAARPTTMDQQSIDAWTAGLKAGSAKNKTARTAAIKKVLDAADAGSLGHGQAMFVLAMLDDLDDAFAQGQLYRPLDPITPPFLFLAPTAAMRSDPRFMPLAYKLGLVDYWRSTGHWPDFCGEPGLPYDCQAEAGKDAKYVRN